MRNIWTSFLVLFCAGLLENCGSRSSAPTPPTAVEKATTLMVASPWTMKSLTIDGTADDTFFVGLQITFTASGFTAKNGDPVWPASGTWSFTDANATFIKRSDDLTIQLDELTASNMQLTLVWTSTTTSGGRANSVAGKHVFVFSH